MKMQLLPIIGAAVIAVAIGFFAGIKYDQGRQSTKNAVFTMGGNGRGGGNRMGFRPVAGEIMSSDNTSVTVKLQDGGSKIVLLTDKTTISKAETASKSDLKVGEKVAAFGQENSDGSVSAQTIQLNPISRGFDRPQASPTQRF